MLPADVSALIRASIFVRDLPSAARFYGALGFTEVYYEGVLDHPSACSVIGFATTRPLSIKIVKQPGPNFGMVGLFELHTDLAADVLPRAVGPARIGEVALVFYVRSLAGSLAALRAAGATWSPEPQLFRMEHRAQLEVCLRDCDGVLLNLVETDPAQQLRTGPELSYQNHS